VFAGVRKPSDLGNLPAPGAGGDVVPILLDVTNQDLVDEARAVVQDAVGDAGLTAVINNAAYALWSPAECVQPADLQAIMDVNVTGVLRVTQAFLPLLRRGERARVINISSVAGTVALPCWSTYNSSKFALEGLTDCLRLELREQGIAVVLVKPGPVKTPIWSNGQRYTSEALPDEHPEAHHYTKLFLKACPPPPAPACHHQRIHRGDMCTQYACTCIVRSFPLPAPVRTPPERPPPPLLTDIP
jgi:NAD(P)-dependent dehydrogenase (short-subunit alcohol dehydrogenase family)